MIGKVVPFYTRALQLTDWVLIFIVSQEALEFHNKLTKLCNKINQLTATSLWILHKVMDKKYLVLPMHIQYHKTTGFKDAPPVTAMKLRCTL